MDKVKKPPNIRALRSPWRITFDTNPDDCTLNCIMCEEFSEFSKLKQLHINQGFPAKRRMEYSLIENVIENVINKKELKEIIPSTMGEPLLYKDFEKIVNLCQTYDLKLNLTTNGSFPRKSALQWAKIILPVASDVKISWNGSNPETAEKIMKKLSFEKAMENVMQVVEIRNQIAKEGGNYCSLTFQMTFMEVNYCELPEIIQLASQLGIDRIKGHHLWVHFKEIEHLSMKRSQQSIKEWNKIVTEAYKALLVYPKKDGSYLKLDNIYPLDYTESELQVNFEWVCPFLGREAWIAWDGKFNPCCAPDEERKQLGFYGNVNIKPLSDIWSSHSYKQLIRTYWTQLLCQRCHMRRPMEDLHN